MFISNEIKKKMNPVSFHDSLHMLTILDVRNKQAEKFMNGKYVCIYSVCR